MKMSCKLSPDDSNPQEVHGHPLFKKDGFADSIPSKFTPNLRGFSTKKLLGLGISSRVFSAPLRKREKEGFFKRMKKNFTNWVYLEYDAGNFKKVRQHGKGPFLFKNSCIQGGKK